MNTTGEPDGSGSGSGSGNPCGNIDPSDGEGYSSDPDTYAGVVHISVQVDFTGTAGKYRRHLKKLVSSNAILS